MEVVRIWIGSEERAGRGEIVLAHGIRKYASGPVEVVNMREGEPQYKEWELKDWNMGRTHYRPYSGEGWATSFTCFRFSIPEIAGFKGRCIYMDADQTVHGDVHELAAYDLQGKACSIRKGVILLDCGHPFWRSEQWPSLATMKASGWGIGEYHRRINAARQNADPFPVEWDVLDGKEMSPRKAKLNHLTDMRRQSYAPHSDRFEYPLMHDCPELDMVFWESYGDALASMAQMQRPRYSRFRNILKWTIGLERSLGLNRWGRPEGYRYYFTEEEQFLRDSQRLNPRGFRGDPDDVKGLLPLL